MLTCDSLEGRLKHDQEGHAPRLPASTEAGQGDLEEPMQGKSRFGRDAVSVSAIASPYRMRV
jgi:hypothetical protein